MKHLLVLGVLAGGLLSACSQPSAISTPAAAPHTFSEYWFSGLAEISSYQLEQARYGELRSGEAVLVFVTEPFSKEKQVKADNPTADDRPVLKLNMEKKFLTGIYPYSMLCSSFVPVEDSTAHATKIAASVQEWCGQAYSQLNNRGSHYQLQSFSYFETEGDRQEELPMGWMEDEIWAKIRLNPQQLPLGESTMAPSLFYCRLLHKELKPYQVHASLAPEGDSLMVYTLQYPELNRSLSIWFQQAFPYAIESWEETYVDGWNANAKVLRTRARKIKQLRLDYWTKNHNSDLGLRKELGLSH